MTPSDFSKSVISLACWRAAQNELHQVMLSVCQVFLNQADAGWFENDVYTCASVWLMENPGTFPDTRGPQFQALLSKLDAVLDKQVADRTGGALWFGPKTEERIEGSITATIGSLIFVR